jgi:hypothetical protein
MVCRRWVLVGVMCVGLIGCQVSTAPTPVARFDRRHAVSMMTAPWDGQYALEQDSPEPKAPRKVIQTAHLRKGEPLGFRQRETGVVAVAGELEVPLGPGAYQWEMRADKGQADTFMTVVLITVIVVVVVGIVVAVVAVKIDNNLKHSLGGINGYVY